MRIWIASLILLHTFNVFAENPVIKQVLDGNLIELDNGEKIELAGVDISMAKQQVHTYMKSHFEGQNVILEYEKSNDNRRKAYVFVDIATQPFKRGDEDFVLSDFITDDLGRKTKGIFINASLIKAGYAIPLQQNTTYIDLFNKLHNEAKNNEKGVWAKDKFYIRQLADQYAIEKGYKLERYKKPFIQFLEAEDKWIIDYHDAPIFDPNKAIGDHSESDSANFKIYIIGENKNIQLIQE